MTHLLAVSPNPFDATSLYRGMGPLGSLQRSHNLKVSINPPHINWVNLKSSDVLFLQRPFSNEHLAQSRAAKVNSKPLWVDYDDNLAAIPLCNNMYPLYSDPTIQHNIATIVAMADAVSVTTQDLKEALAKVLKMFPEMDGYALGEDKIHVVPNAYDWEIHGKMPEKRAAREKVMIWRGGRSHEKDMLNYTNAMCGAIARTEGWRFEFIGNAPWPVLERFQALNKPQTIMSKQPIDPVDFYRYIAYIKPEAIIVPLADMRFNYSKSNIAWLEGIVAGAVALAPDWPEWRRPGCINYKDPEDFEAKMYGLTQGEFDTDKLWAEGRDYVMENLALDKVNRLRMGIIDKLMGRT